MKEKLKFVNGAEYDFGTVAFSEEQIIDFASTYDPLSFHIDMEAAQKSLFRGLVASGPHAFHYFYINQWIPLFGNTVLAGLEMTNWKFLKPVYATKEIRCKVKITELINHQEKGTVSVRWYFQFLNRHNELYQHLDMLVLHRE